MSVLLYSFVYSNRDQLTGERRRCWSKGSDPPPKTCPNVFALWVSLTSFLLRLVNFDILLPKAKTQVSTCMHNKFDTIMVNFCLVYMSVTGSGFNPNTSLFSTKVKTSELTRCLLDDVSCFVFEFLSLICIDVKPLKCEQQKASSLIQQHIA